MTMRYRKKRNIAVAIAAAVTVIALIASTAGFVARASSLPTQNAPEHVEKVVTDLSKYVLLHQTRNANRLLILAPDDVVPCDESKTHERISKLNSI